jgi:hypothetical protein
LHCATLPCGSKPQIPGLQARAGIQDARIMKPPSRAQGLIITFAGLVRRSPPAATQRMTKHLFTHTRMHTGHRRAGHHPAHAREVLRRALRQRRKDLVQVVPPSAVRSRAAVALQARKAAPRCEPALPQGAKDILCAVPLCIYILELLAWGTHRRHIRQPGKPGPLRQQHHPEVPPACLRSKLPHHALHISLRRSPPLAEPRNLRCNLTLHRGAKAPSGLPRPR